VGESSSVWPEIFRVLSQIKWRFLNEVSGKNNFGRFFSEIYTQTKAILYKNLWNFALLSAIFILRPYCTEKIQTSTFICCLHPGKEERPQTNHEKKIRGRKAWMFVSEKSVLFTLGLGLTTHYSLGVFGWNFYHTFLTVSIQFWPRVESQIRPIRWAINFSLITARAERKVCLCVKLFDFFRGWILLRLTWNLSRFVPNSVEILTWSFWKKLFWENFLEIFTQTKAILYQNLWNFALLSAVFILRSYCTEKIDTSTFICCLHPGKETQPQTNYKEKIRGRKVRTLFLENRFCSLSVWDLLRLTPWVFWYEIFTRRSSLCLLSFGRDLSPRLVRQDWQ